MSDILVKRKFREIKKGSNSEDGTGFLSSRRRFLTVTGLDGGREREKERDGKERESNEIQLKEHFEYFYHHLPCLR